MNKTIHNGCGIARASWSHAPHFSLLTGALKGSGNAFAASELRPACSPDSGSRSELTTTMIFLGDNFTVNTTGVYLVDMEWTISIVIQLNGTIGRDPNGSSGTVGASAELELNLYVENFNTGVLTFVSGGGLSSETRGSNVSQVQTQVGLVGNRPENLTGANLYGLYLRVEFSLFTRASGVGSSAHASLETGLSGNRTALKLLEVG
jgi:hypothetical protein